jgi:hypothetical protein
MTLLWYLSKLVKYLKESTRDLKGQWLRFKSGPFDLQPLTWLSIGLILLCVFAFLSKAESSTAFSTIHSESNYCIYFVLVSGCFTISVACIYVAICLTPPTLPRKFRDRAGWLKAVENGVRKREFILIVYSAFAAPIALGLLLENAKLDVIDFQSKLIQTMNQHEDSIVISNIFYASYHCDREYGLNDPYCSELAKIFKIALSNQGSISTNIYVKKACTEALPFPIGFQTGFADLASACTTLKDSRMSDFPSPKSFLTVFVPILLDDMLCYVMGLILANAIFNQFYKEKLRHYCERSL